MYCPINNSENERCRCISRCCRLYNLALAFLAALIFGTVTFVLGILFAPFLFTAIPLFIVAAIILIVLFIVTLITRGCCEKDDCE